MGNMRFKVGDRVRIKSLDWYNENKDSNGNIVFSSKVPHFALCVNVRTVFTKDMAKFCGKVVTIETVWTANYSIVEGTHRDYFTDEMIEGLVEEEKVSNINSITQDRVDKLACKIDEELPYGNPYEWELPEGYQFVDENGNVINATKIVLEKKKKEYPKSYDECCKVLNIAVRDLDILDNMLDTTEIIYNKNLDRLLNSFRKLLICRDAYWKVAGEEMGLGKPWKPDWEDEHQEKYIIGSWLGTIQALEENFVSHPLAFPTAEMRDAFYENFKELIEECKELL